MKIYLTAIVKSTISAADELREVLLNMVVQSRKEVACIQYDLHEDKQTQTFIFQEEWVDQSGLDLHNEQAYIVNFVKEAARLTTSVVIYKTIRLA